ncbi:hypothetical protein [Ahrensia marina]|nr:hypothetical protein [Ahrensia marina]
MEKFRHMLTGGHPNSLGRTLDVVECVLDDHERFEELYQCYFSDDEVVRLRTSNAIRRVFKEHPEWFEDYVERLMTEITQIDQPSTKWTLSQLWLEYRSRLTGDQMERAKEYLVVTLHEEDDWIVLNMTMKTLQHFVKDDPSLIPKIAERARLLAKDRRNSVAKGAVKLLNAAGEPVDLLK